MSVLTLTTLQTWGEVLHAAILSCYLMLGLSDFNVYELLLSYHIMTDIP